MCSLAPLNNSNNLTLHRQDLSPALKFLNFTYSDVLDHFPEGVFIVNNPLGVPQLHC